MPNKKGTKKKKSVSPTAEADGATTLATEQVWEQYQNTQQINEAIHRCYVGIIFYSRGLLETSRNYRMLDQAHVQALADKMSEDGWHNSSLLSANFEA